MSDNSKLFSLDPANDPAFLAALQELNYALANTGENLEGNVCYLDNASPAEFRDSRPTDDINHVKKRVNLKILCRRHRSMLEIGLNGGHSALICLMSNPSLHFFSVDICAHHYTRHAVNYLKTRFGRRFHFHEGDSRDVMPRLAIEKPHLRFDLLHIDGGHGAALAYTDISNSLRMKSADAELVFDDVNALHLNEVLELYIQMGYLSPPRDRSDLYETVLHEVLEVCP